MLNKSYENHIKFLKYVIESYENLDTVNLLQMYAMSSIKKEIDKLKKPINLEELLDFRIIFEDRTRLGLKIGKSLEIKQVEEIVKVWNTLSKKLGISAPTLINLITIKDILKERRDNPLQNIEMLIENVYQNNKIFKVIMVDICDNLNMESLHIEGESWDSFYRFILCSKALVADNIEAYGNIRLERNKENLWKYEELLKDVDENIWIDVCYQIVSKLTLDQFERDSDIKSRLLATDKSILVCTSKDKVLGVSNIAEKFNTPREWDGLNLIGAALMNTRTELQEEGDTIMKELLGF